MYILTLKIIFVKTLFDLTIYPSGTEGVAVTPFGVLSAFLTSVLQISINSNSTFSVGINVILSKGTVLNYMLYQCFRNRYISMFMQNNNASLKYTSDLGAYFRREFSFLNEDSILRFMFVSNTGKTNVLDIFPYEETSNTQTICAYSQGLKFTVLVSICERVLTFEM